MDIFVESFSSIKLDGIASGDALSVYSNYPSIAADLLAALTAYDEGRQSTSPQINLSALSEALIQGSFDEWLTASWATSSIALSGSMALIAALESGDIEGVQSSFHKIAAVNPPTQAQLEEWQAILDGLEIPKEVLAFIPDQAEANDE